MKRVTIFYLTLIFIASMMIFVHLSNEERNQIEGINEELSVPTRLVNQVAHNFDDGVIKICNINSGDCDVFLKEKINGRN